MDGMTESSTTTESNKMTTATLPSIDSHILIDEYCLHFEGRSVIIGEASLNDFRLAARLAKIGSGVWRAGAKKSEFVAAFAAHVAGVPYDSSIAEPIVTAVAAVPTLEGVSLKHNCYPILRAILAADVPVYLVGPPGSGKSTIAHQIADDLGLEFHTKSCSIQTSEISLLGYQDANGRLVRTPLREAYEHGGVFLLDEIDAGSPAVLVVLNALLANGHCAFPDGLIPKHKDFRFIAGANTFGTGASREFVGRQQLDAATLDRFAFVEMNYDRALEARLAGVARESETSEYGTVKTPKGVDGEAWLARVEQTRDKVAEHKLRHVISPRATIYGVALLKAGLSKSSVERLVLRKNLDDGAWGKIK